MTRYRFLDDDDDNESHDPPDDDDRAYDIFVDEVISGERKPRTNSEYFCLEMWKERHAKQPHPAR